MMGVPAIRCPTFLVRGCAAIICPSRLRGLDRIVLADRARRYRGLWRVAEEWDRTRKSARDLRGSAQSEGGNKDHGGRDGTIEFAGLDSVRDCADENPRWPA